MFVLLLKWSMYYTVHLQPFPGVFPVKVNIILERILTVIGKIEKSADGTFEWKNSRFVDALIEGTI